MTNYLRSNMDDFVIDKDAPKDTEAEVDELMQLDVVIDREAVQEIISKEIVPDLSNVEVIEPPSDGDEDEPDVEDIKDPKIYEDNHCGCVMPQNSRLDALREVFDEETCADVLIGYYEACSKLILQLWNTIRGAHFLMLEFPGREYKHEKLLISCRKETNREKKV